MNEELQIHTTALGDGREPSCVSPDHQAGKYRIQLSDESLNFETVELTDPVPLGRQILGAGNLRNVENYSLYAVLPSGDFEDVRLDETFDVRGRGVEQFVYFLTDRAFKFTVENAQIFWGNPVLSGASLHKLANPKEGEAVYLEVRGGEDRLVEPTENIDLTNDGIERFFNAPVQTKTYEIVVNTRAKTVDSPTVTYEQLVQLAYPGPQDANVEFSISYRKTASKPHSGELSAGDSVTVKKKGSVFNVHRTIKS
jgi:hypothetical protein